MLLAYGIWKINKDIRFPGKWAVFPVMGTVLVILAGPQAWINKKILSKKIAVWFGLISFPLYLWHWPLLSFARIIENEPPGHEICTAVIIISILLAWLTVRFLEKPFRFSSQRSVLKLNILVGLMIGTGFLGFFVSKGDFENSHGYEKLLIKRKGFEHALGSSLSWYKGKEDWLFLGNAHANTVAKLKLAITPSYSELRKSKEIFSKISRAASDRGIKVALIIGPNKSSIYPEYLPSKIIPSSKRYIDFFIDELKGIPNLIVYDPTNDLLNAKESEGILYYKTDTHWNKKGAFLAYSGLSKLLGTPIPEVHFKLGQARPGDLIGISKLKNFPLCKEDNWDIWFKENSAWQEEKIPDEQITSFGAASVSVNKNPLSEKYVWVLGDSFTVALKPYFNSAFKEVRYIGHWAQKINDLPTELAKAKRKPDLVVIVRVERSF
ncbi:acyltransferase family protein [Methylocaldum szegediense]|nr:acyltransferase family protein [Methylocaldum szegediense]